MNIYDISITDIKKQTFTLERYKNKVLLIVNVASKCGFTNQYDALQALYDQYEAKGLAILAFPCNQFANQEPASEQAIMNFCEANFAITFDLFAKIYVNGKNTHPLYQHLKREKKGVFATEFIKWNFTKFLVDRQGNVVKRFPSQLDPKKIAKYIEQLL